MTLERGFADLIKANLGNSSPEELSAQLSDKRSTRFVSLGFATYDWLSQAFKQRRKLHAARLPLIFYAGGV